jgi:glycosyltransferase involved in cell wall biosynthesis
MSRPRVLQLISSGGLYGAENMALELTRGLLHLGCATSLGVFLNAHRPNLQVAEAAQSQGLEVELFECQGRIDKKTIQRVRDCLSRSRIDILHTHGYKANAYGLLATKSTSVKTIATSHNWPGRTLSLRAYGLLDRLQLRFFDRVCAVSESVRHSLLQALVPDRKITVVQNGIDCERFLDGRQVLRNTLQSKDGLLVGYVGRLAPEKDLHSLLRAAKAILMTLPSVSFVLCGEGPERRSLQTLAFQLGIEKSVLFLGQRSDIPDLYSSFDVVVLPSLTEGMPLAILEAMAAKKPIVASRVGAVPKILEDGKSGLLVEPGNAKELESALLRLLLNPEKRLCFGQAGFDVVQSNFSSKVMAQIYLSIYTEVLSTKFEDRILSPLESGRN